MARRFDVIHACVSSLERPRARLSKYLETAGRETVHVDPERLEQELDSIEVLLCADPPQIDWSRAKRLKLLQLMGSGVDRLWPAKGLPPDVEIANVRGIHLPEMRDHALALMLAFERNLPRAFARQRERRWLAETGGSLSGKTVCVLGLGEVGRAVASVCAALGMRVVGVRAEPRPTPHVDQVFGPEDVDGALKAADYVVVLVPLIERTRGLLGGRALSILRPGAVLIHLSRGGVVDEAALSDALRAGSLAGAAVDVFEEEPLPPESPLWSAPRLVITPHVAGRVSGYFERALAVFVENLERAEMGNPPKTRVDRLRGY